MSCCFSDPTHDRLFSSGRSAIGVVWLRTGQAGGLAKVFSISPSITFLLYSLEAGISLNNVPLLSVILDSFLPSAGNRQGS